MVIADATGSLLLEENRRRLLAELVPLIRSFEERYELRSADLSQALADGRIMDTEEICDWLIAWETYRALEAGGPPRLE